jgi:AI-2 transport protein TqsA
MKAREQERQIQTVCLLVLSTIATGAALYWLSAVLIPFVLAVFLTFCLIPVIDFQTQRLRFPPWLAYASTAVMGLLLFAVFGFVIMEAVGEISANAAKYKATIEQLRRDAEGWIPAEPFGIQLRDDTRPLIELPAKALGDLVSGLIAALMSIFSNGILVLIFTMFMLAGRTKASAPPAGIWRDVESRVNRYIITKVAVSIFTAALVGSTLSILGVDLAFVFGFFAFFLNFIPSLGSIAATVLPLPVVLVDPELPVAVKVLAFAVPGSLQFAVGNIIEPKLMGGSLDLHPVAVVLSLILFGMIWGVVGMFLAAPITGVIKILCERLPLTKPVAGLLAGRLEAVGGAAKPGETKG